MSDDYTYPPEFIKKVEQRIQKQVEGNGVDPADIKLTIVKQGLDVMTGKTYFELDCDVQTISEKGDKTKGRVIKQGELQKEIDTYLNSFAAKETLDSKAKDIIESLPHKGFATDKQNIPLPQDKLTLTEHVVCQKCQGQKMTACSPCQGRGLIQCQLCYSTGMMRCLQCNGARQVQAGGEMQPCQACQGRGEIMCTQCRGQKMSPCPHCQSKGTLSCDNCAGQGKNSNHATITPQLNVHGDVLMDDMDPYPKIMASKIGAVALAEGGHITIKQVNHAVEDKDAPDHNVIEYEAAMPWAVTQFIIGKTPYKIHQAGLKGAVCDSGNFMDDLIQPEMEKITMAAKGNGFVAGLLKEVCNDSRVSRETLGLIAQKGMKRAAIELQKTYNLGLTKKTLQSFVKYAYSAEKRITRRPRYIGLGVGLAVSLLINYLWFMYGIGADMKDNQSQNIQMIMDGIPLILGLFVTLSSIKTVGYFTFQSVMKDIGIPTKKMPPVGKAGLYGLIGNILLWGGFWGFTILL